MSKNLEEKIDELVQKIKEGMAADALMGAFDANKDNGVTLGMIMEYKEYRLCKTIDDVALLIVNRLVPAPSETLRVLTLAKLNETLESAGVTFDTLTWLDVNDGREEEEACEE